MSAPPGHCALLPWEKPMLALTWCSALVCYKVTLWNYFFISNCCQFLSARTEVDCCVTWHKAAQMSIWCPKGHGWVSHHFSSAALSAGSSPTRDNPAEKSLLFSNRTKLLLVGIYWTSFLWWLMRTYQSSAACTRRAGMEGKMQKRWCQQPDRPR